MTRTEIDQIKRIIADSHEALSEGGNPRTLPLHLTELCTTIKTLMDEIVETNDKDMKVALACLEYAGRKEKRANEERLAVRN